MKRIFTLLLIFFIVLTFLCACSPFQNTGEIPPVAATSQPIGPVPSEITVPVTVPSDPPPTELPEEPLFCYDKYKISASAQEYLTEQEYAMYRKMVDAVIDHSGVIEGFSSHDSFHKLWVVLLTEFVPAKGMIQSYRHSEEPYLYENGTATLRFLADKETCDSNYATFENIVNKALSLIRADDDEWERIAKLFLYVSSEMRYGSPYTEYGLEPNQYNSIVYGLGICGNYADYLNMLASQIGFEAIRGHSLGSNMNASVDHAWSVICVEGEWYHFDACWQLMDYFALSTQERYDSLLRLNTTGEPCEITIFMQNDYTGDNADLPYCENGMNKQARAELFESVSSWYWDAMHS